MHEPVVPDPLRGRELQGTVRRGYDTEMTFGSLDSLIFPQGEKEQSSRRNPPSQDRYDPS
jgi:hypothetical protein